MEHTILFNHIPKTGGTTLRIIFNKVYGKDRVYFIRSTDIGSSFREFESFDRKTRDQYRVISGHGAEMFSEFIENPFKVSILREPVSLFLSQFHFLRESPGSDFYDDVRNMSTPDEYLEYARKKGQDNLLTRYFSDSMQFLINNQLSVPDLEMEGENLLAKAKENLKAYDALLDLSRFDRGVYALADKLNWEGVPVYRPSNITRKKENSFQMTGGFHQKLRHVLRFDIALYEYFIKNDLEVSSMTQDGLNLSLFLLRQKGINYLARILGKK